MLEFVLYNCIFSINCFRADVANLKYLFKLIELEILQKKNALIIVFNVAH